MIIVKTVKEKDTHVLALLGRTTYSESHSKFITDKADLIKYNNSAFSIKQIQSEIKDDNNIFYIAFFDDFPVGYTKIIKNAKSKYINSTNICRLERIYVLEEFLGMKIGLKLLNSALRKAQELEFEEIWLTTYVKNFKAIDFYIKNSFCQVGSFNFLVNRTEYPNFVFSKKI